MGGAMWSALRWEDEGSSITREKGKDGYSGHEKSLWSVATYTWFQRAFWAKYVKDTEICALSSITGKYINKKWLMLKQGLSYENLFYIINSRQEKS